MASAQNRQALNHKSYSKDESSCSLCLNQKTLDLSLFQTTFTKSSVILKTIACPELYMLFNGEGLI